MSKVELIIPIFIFGLIGSRADLRKEHKKPMMTLHRNYYKKGILRSNIRTTMLHISSKSRKKLMINSIFTSAILFAFFISSCSTKSHDESLSPPEFSCPKVMEWKGIRPGQSESKDVIDILGKPNKKGTIKFNDKRKIKYFQYELVGGLFTGHLQNRIFFRTDGKVDWIEEIVADQDGKFHNVAETVSQIGESLDYVFLNNNANPFAKYQFDVLLGPDVVFVWSECGLALIAIPSGFLVPLVHDFEISQTFLKDILKVRYPGKSNYEIIPEGIEYIVMIRFLFQPTNFDTFQRVYKHRIPYLEWTYVLYKVSQP